MKFLTSEDYNFVAAGVWEGVDGGGCIPSPFPKKDSTTVCRYRVMKELNKNQLVYVIGGASLTYTPDTDYQVWLSYHDIGI